MDTLLPIMHHKLNGFSFYKRTCMKQVLTTSGDILDMVGIRTAGKKHFVHWEANQRPTREVGL